MKLPNEQKLLLSASLQKELLYRETYTEFYDHVVSALEIQPDNTPFQLAVEKIIQEDFGGSEGMSAIERQYKNTVTKEIKNKYRANMVGYFRFPFIGFTIVFTIALYWVTRQPWFNFFIFFGIVCSMRIIPDLLKWIRNYKLGYGFIRSQRSVKDGVFNWLSFNPAIVFSVVAIISELSSQSPSIWFKNVTPIMSTGLLLLCSLHILTFCSIYKSEFKFNVAH